MKSKSEAFLSHAFSLMLLGAALLFVGCSHANKAEKIDTKLDREARVSGDEEIGENKSGDMVWHKKVLINEELRSLQNQVYELEDKVYGSRKYGSSGHYGELKTCSLKLSSLDANAKSSGAAFSEPMDRLTDKEDEFQVGIDEKDKLVGVSEEYLKDRIKRFSEYKKILMKKDDDFVSRIESCRSELKLKGYNAQLED